MHKRNLYEDITNQKKNIKTNPKGLWYPKGSNIETIVYADSDHEGDYVDRKSTSGVCTFMGCCLTSWFSKKQTALAISTTEAEYVSAGKACQQAIWIKQALIDYGVRLDDILIMCDNKGAIDLSLPNLGLWYPKDSPFDLEAYSDSDYAGASLDMKSTTGGCQFLRSILISWQCKKQTVVANSTTEAEYITASSCCGQSNAKTKIINNKTQIHAKVDGKKIVITESSIRSDLLFIDEDGIDCLTNIEIFENLQLIRNLDSGSSKILMYPIFLEVFLDKQLGKVPAHNAIYKAPCHTKKVFSNMRRIGTGFSGEVTPLFATMLDLPQSKLGEGSRQPTGPQFTPIVDIPSDATPIPTTSSSHQKTQKYEAVYFGEDDRMERATTIVSSLKAGQSSGNINRTQSMATPARSSSLRASSEGGLGCHITLGDTPVQTSVVSPTRTAKDTTDDDLTIAKALTEIRKSAAKDKVAHRLHEEEQAKFKEEQEMLTRAERAEEEEGHSSAQVNTFVPMDSEGVQDSGVKVAGSEKTAESSKKRTRAKLGEESVKRQKLKDDAVTTRVLGQHLS
ncbi:hypothetical protein Tco_0432014 [Tanacetum coccineum]